jgi:hypothetical protein
LASYSTDAKSWLNTWIACPPKSSSRPSVPSVSIPLGAPLTRVQVFVPFRESSAFVFRPSRSNPKSFHALVFFVVAPRGCVPR